MLEIALGFLWWVEKTGNSGSVANICKSLKVPIIGHSYTASGMNCRCEGNWLLANCPFLIIWTVSILANVALAE
jgi:hypothetical protein